eukprot:TRINITY_DN2376_c0_g1_i14.p1 TRINITY_DN2376_c0_g1~~TRINITY_DN2376_c0_g1_i14.p1  ORF type:complete len:160 (+),score=11.40 TRINITY_DN2376_c0_g1_i14:504-983(+)
MRISDFILLLKVLKEDFVIECEKEITLEIFKSIIYGSNLIPLIEDKLLLEEAYNIPECYQDAHELLKQNVESVIALFTERLIAANVYDKDWKVRMEVFAERVEGESTSTCKFGKRNSCLHQLQIAARSNQNIAERCCIAQTLSQCLRLLQSPECVMIMN